MSLVLGIDPGSRVTGYGVIDVQGNRLSYVDCGCIRSEGGALPARLKKYLMECCNWWKRISRRKLRLKRFSWAETRRLHLSSDRPEVPRWQPACNLSSRSQNIRRGR